jgi:outer membrane protein insertion porin family
MGRQGSGRTPFRIVGAVLAVLATLLLGLGQAVAQIITIDPASEASTGVRAIAVEGNRRVDPEAIRSYFHRGPGGHIDAAAVDAGLKALVGSGLFEDVRIRRAGDRLIVSVVERAVISKLAFEGNSKLKDDQLRAEIQSKAGEALSRANVHSDVIRLGELYRRSGYLDANVEPKIIERPSGRVDLVFEIQEGKKTGVKSIEFVGNKAYSGFRLRQIVKSGTTNLLSFFLDNDIYDPDRIEGDRELLRRFYLDHGYSDVRIVAAAASYDPARKGFVVTFTIDEGPLYHIGTVDVRSQIRTIDPATLRGNVRTGTGDIANAGAVDKTADALSMELARRGHSFAVVRPRLDRDRKTRVVNIVYEVEDGPRLYVERINIRGNTKTHDEVIRREFDIVEGDAFNRALIDRAERRLKNLGFFKTVKITSEPGTARDRVVVIVEVQEQPTGEYSVSGGYSTVDGWLGEVKVGERNFLGTGNYVKAALQYGQYARGFDVGFVEPYFLGYRMSFGEDVFARQSWANPYQSYGSTVYGATSTLGTPLSEDTAIAWRYSLSRQSITIAPALMDCSPSNPPPGCYANGEASVPVKQAALAGPQWVSAVGYTLTYNTLDNVRYPTNGVRSDFRQDFAGVGGDVRYLKSTEDFRAYHDIGGDVVAVAREQGGYVTPWGGQPLPLLNGFFGGPDLVRGFAPNGFGPRDVTPGTTKDNLGGTIFWGSSFELRTPAPFLPPEFGLRVAAFADSGSLFGYRGTAGTPSLSQSLQVADSKTIRSSVGASLIWDSPLGPLRVDYAYPTSKASYDVTQRLRFGAYGF